MTTEFTLIAHRGASYEAPENTLPAFDLAFKQGADFIEADFWLTADYRIASIHDASTVRVAPGQKKHVVSQSNMTDLQFLDVGSWKHSSFSGTRIPTLEEVLDLIPQGKGIYIEIKDPRPEIINHLEKVIQNSRVPEELIKIMAFDPVLVSTAKERMPGIKVYWLYYWYLDQISGEPSNSESEILSVLKQTAADGLDINNCIWVNNYFMEALCKLNKELVLYTVDLLVDAVRFISIGADKLTTNRPAELRRELNDYFKPVIDHSGKAEKLTLGPNGNYSFLPQRDPDED